MIKALFKKRNKLISFFILLAVFFVFYALNKRTPLWSDDWAFYFAYGEKRARHLADVFSSVGYFYFHVNGRSVANFIVVLFAYLGKNVFNFFNALMFVFLGMLIYLFSSDDKKLKPVGLWGIFLLLWFCLPAANQTIFWMCGSVVYLWMAVIGLVFLWPYKKLLIEKRNIFFKKAFTGVSFMFIFGLLAGNSHELLAPAIIFLLSLSAGIIFWKQNQMFSRWSIAGASGVFLGLAMQLLAPSNFIKFNSDMRIENFGGAIFQNLAKIIPGALERQYWLWIIIGAIFCVYWLNKLFLKKRGLAIDGAMFAALIAAIILDGLSVFFPYFPSRAYFFSSVFLVIFIGRFLLQENFWKTKYFLIFIFTPILILSVRTTLEQSKALAEKYAEREASISTQKAQGKRDIAVERLGKVRNEKLLGDTLSRDNHLGASRFYGVDSIRLK